MKSEAAGNCTEVEEVVPSQEGRHTRKTHNSSGIAGIGEKLPPAVYADSETQRVAAERVDKVIGSPKNILQAC